MKKGKSKTSYLGVIFTFFICLSCTNPLMELARDKQEKTPEPEPTPSVTYDEFPQGTIIHRIFNAADESEWESAVGAIINGGNNKNYVINISGDVSLVSTWTPTFGGVSGVTVSLRGYGGVMTLIGGNGSIVRAGSDQTIILRDLTLWGGLSTSHALVFVHDNGTVTMYGGEIGNFGTGVDNKGTFAMHGGKISSTYFNGVYNYGTFTMHDGEISGCDTDPLTSGVYNYGTFRIVNGTIFGSDEGDGRGNALLRADGTVEYGTFSGSAWNRTGSLLVTAYKDTIRVLDGVLQPIFDDVAANGFPSLTTTAIILTIYPAIAGLNADDITLSGIPGISKGTVSASGFWYTLPISGFTQGGTLTVSVSKVGYTISGSTKTVEIYHSSITNHPLEMTAIPAGTFTMGSPEDEPGRLPDETQHEVTLTGFSMSIYPVTQVQYEAVMGTNPSTFNRSGSRASLVEGRDTAKFPVESVSWYDAIVFCNRLSIREGLSPAYTLNGSTNPDDWGPVPRAGYPGFSDPVWDTVQIVADSNGYRLPTEAQWEYVCRAGTTTAYHWGDTISGDNAWYNVNSGEGIDVVTHGVGLKPANAWGLYDIHGNVSEWCGDWFGNYATGPQTDPTGPVDGDDRVRRGGEAGSNGHFLRSANRESDAPGDRSATTGFRVCK